MPNIRKIEIQAHNGSFARRPANYIDVRILAANTAEAYTVPTDTGSNRKAQYVIFSANCDFWVTTDGTTAAIPAADISDGTSPELNPTQYILGGSVTTLSLISATGGAVNMSFYM